MPHYLQLSRPSSGVHHDWALILAGGEGSRLRSLTTTAGGVAVPKQFCSFGGDGSLLQDALHRAQSVTTPERTCVVVSEHHRAWWQALDLQVPAANVIEQPLNRGTAIGILLPLLAILHRDPDAGLLVLPSDHFVRQESVLASSLRAAMRSIRWQLDQIVILGIAPDDADPELGYLVVEQSGAGELRPDELRPVREFVEKPHLAAARELIARGGVWNSFIFAARGHALLRAFEDRIPDVVAEMREIVSRCDPWTRPARLIELYERAPDLDFSRDILQRSPTLLSVLTVPPCGWSDLGTPRRVSEALSQMQPSFQHARRSNTGRVPFLDLTQLSSQTYLIG